MKSIPRTRLATALAAAAWVALAPAAFAQDPPAAPAASPEAREAERQARLQLADSGLQKLYRIQPEARAAVEAAVGYAVFEVDSIYAVLFVGQKGKGVLFDNATKKPVFMNSSRAGTGPGVGKQKVYQVFVFKSKGAMEQFMAAGTAGADVGASVSTGKDGMVRSFNPSIDIYQVPESGMAVQASWGGTVYTVDAQLQQ
jgi:lipid-binding SYLF domain-containing protein